MTLTRHSGIFPCTTGEHLPFLDYFGMGADSRVQSAFDFLIDHMRKADALTCGRYQHRDCLWGAIAALKGLELMPANLQTSQVDRVVTRLAERLLEMTYDFEREHKRWLTFGVPRAWDLLSALRVLAHHGHAGDPRFKPLLDRVLARRDEEGRLICGSTSRTWPIERRSRPSKWVTLDLLRVLKTAGIEDPALER